MLKQNTPLRCRIVERVLTIEIGIDTLKKAAEMHGGFWQPVTDKYALVVSRPHTFARDVRNELMREEEDGSTPLHRLLDKVIEEAVNQGSEGVDHDSIDTIEEAERRAANPTPEGQ